MVKPDSSRDEKQFIKFMEIPFKKILDPLLHLKHKKTPQALNVKTKLYLRNVKN